MMITTIKSLRQYIKGKTLIQHNYNNLKVMKILKKKS